MPQKLVKTYIGRYQSQTENALDGTIDVAEDEHNTHDGGHHDHHEH